MKKKTYYHIILDQSGSMQDCIEPTISGFNEQVQVIRSLQQRYAEQELSIGLTCFNDEVNIVSFGRPVNEQRQLTREEYRPNGPTALYDAIGETVLRIKDRLASTAQVQEDTSVIVVILTDGHENASRLFTGKGISNLIRGLEAGGKWTFTYLGATYDAREVAAALSIKRENSMAFEKDQMKETYSKLSKSLGNFFENKKYNRNSGSFLFGENE
ncbi:MAG: VWA domain-containing protein [Chitinophagaceae bacterium]|nr:MAG: VWA domain-containing protein [Chitinophagaceae bacterium]